MRDYGYALWYLVLAHGDAPAAGPRRASALAPHAGRRLAGLAGPALGRAPAVRTMTGGNEQENDHRGRPALRRPGRHGALRGVAGLPLPRRNRQNDADNRGFAGGMNLGAAQAFAQGADAVLLVDNSAVLDAGCVAALAASGADLAAPTIVRGLPPAEGPPWYAGGTLNRRTGEVHHRGGSTFLSGCVLWVKREAWLELDERFFLYHEDADLCWRAADAGYRLAWVPQARAWHEGGAATGSQRRKSPLLDYYDARNGLLLLRKHLQGPRLWLACLWWAFALCPEEPALLVLGPRRAGLRALLAGARDGILGRTGPWHP